MKQGYSGSSLRRVNGLVEKLTTDHVFAEDVARQRDLLNLSRGLKILPRITKINGALIVMEFVRGSEGLTKQNAYEAGTALRILHDQQDFTHQCLNGVHWLVEMANINLCQTNTSMRISEELVWHFQNDALIHSEPTQFIRTDDGRIVFIDIEGIGLGSRYQDLGFVEFTSHLLKDSELFKTFIQGYKSKPIELDFLRIGQMAGLIAIAYSGFADTEKRLSLGIRLLKQFMIIHKS